MTTRPKSILQAIASSTYHTTKQIQNTRRLMPKDLVQPKQVLNQMCTAVWENQSNIDWGIVLHDHPMFYKFRTMRYNGLKADTSSIPAIAAQQYYSRHKMQHLCPSLYKYIRDHTNGIAIEQLAPKLRNVFPSILNSSDHVILQQLLYCIDVWCDNVSMPGFSMIRVN